MSEDMGREAKAREERTPIQQLEESLVAQIIHLEDLLRDHEAASQMRARRLTEVVATLQGLRLVGTVRLFGRDWPVDLHFELPKPPTS